MKWNWMRLLADDIGVSEAEIIVFSTASTPPVYAPKPDLEPCDSPALCPCEA